MVPVCEELAGDFCLAAKGCWAIKGRSPSRQTPNKTVRKEFIMSD
jgi:hypothetical protein